MKIAITGGHFSPALSVIDKLSGHEVIVIGRKYSFEGDTNESYEYKICNKNKIPFFEITTGRLQRKITTKTIPSFLKFPGAIGTSRKILQKESPDVVVTFGGYVGMPIAIAAKSLGIPVVLHEQTQKAGLAAKIIGKFASKILLSFESSKRYFNPKKVEVVGLPLRREIYTAKKEKHQKDLIYITGGSTGSHAINVAVKSILPELLKDFMVVHQTGNATPYRDFETLSNLKKTLKNCDFYKVADFFPPEEAVSYLANASCVISRSGINTVMELIALKTPAVLIPLVTGQKNEQFDNAALFSSFGLGLSISQNDLTPERLISAVRDIIDRKEIYQENFESAQKLIKEDAAGKIAQVIISYGTKRRKSISES